MTFKRRACILRIHRATTAGDVKSTGARGRYRNFLGALRVYARPRAPREKSSLLFFFFFIHPCVSARENYVHNCAARSRAAVVVSRWRMYGRVLASCRRDGGTKSTGRSARKADTRSRFVHIGARCVARRNNERRKKKTRRGRKKKGKKKEQKRERRLGNEGIDRRP